MRFVIRIWCQEEPYVDPTIEVVTRFGVHKAVALAMLFLKREFPKARVWDVEVLKSESVDGPQDADVIDYYEDY